MTPPAKAALREVARKALSQRAGPAAGVEAVIAGAQLAYDDLSRVSAPLIGHVGMDALTGRAVHLAQRQYSWLSGALRPVQADGPFAQLTVCLKGQEPAAAADAATAVLALLIGLLVTFIGDSLTTGLLRRAWPDVLADPTSEEA